MKDHELRELINDVTAVAQIYAHTQQLRQQISQLITPAIDAALKAEYQEGRNSMIRNELPPIDRR